MRTGWILIALLLMNVAVAAAGADPLFIRGDANGDGPVDIADAIFVLGYLFGGGQGPACPDAADPNDDGRIDIGDAIACLNYLFASGRIEPPSPGCGVDPTPDSLSTCAYEGPDCAGPLEQRALETAHAFLNSFLEGGPDPAFLSPAFSFDGFGAARYLDAFWTADDAIPIGEGEGVELVYYLDGETLCFRDVVPLRAFVPSSGEFPVVVELSIQGGCLAGEALVSTYQSWAELMMEEEPGGALRIAAPGARWESETVEPPSEPYAFAVDAVAWGGVGVYERARGVLEPLGGVAGGSVPIDVSASVPDAPPLPAPVDLRVTARLFVEGSPADALHAGLDGLAVAEEWIGTDGAALHVLSGALEIPADLAPGWYSLSASVENVVSEPYSSERITFPVEIVP